jgi:molybdenum cofactor cytidylyltransferase
MTLAIILLAAGASARMAPLDKLTEAVAGQPLLRHMGLAALRTGAPVIVVLPPDRPARTAALRGLGVQTVVAADAADGMAASLRAGIAALADGTTGAMILPADMPGLTTADLTLILRAGADHPGHIIRGATQDGREGHPVLFPASLFPALASLSGDAGGRNVIMANRHLLRLIPLPGENALLDLDTPEAWAAYRTLSGK